MTDKPPGCTGCPAAEWGVGFVPGVGPTAQWRGILFLGQGPGRQEADRSLPFFEFAPSGSMLTRWLHKCGLPRNQVAIGNIVQCWLPALPLAARGRVPVEKWGNREPTRQEQESCWSRHVKSWVDSLPEVVHTVAVGLSAGKFLAGKPADSGFEKYVGTTLDLDNLPDAKELSHVALTLALEPVGLDRTDPRTS